MAPTKLANAPGKLKKGQFLPDILKKTTDDLIDQINLGKFLSQIAEEWGISHQSVLNWIDADEDRSARARKARDEAGFAFDQMAEKRLLGLRPDAGPGEIAQATHLANHYRWRAEKLSRHYAPKQQIEHSGALSLTALVDAAHKPTAPTIDAEAVEVAAEDEAKE